MHCPNCGNESSLDQKFCRNCGFSLEPVSKLIVGSAIHDDEADERSKRQQASLQRMYRCMMWGGAILALGVLLLVTGKAIELPKIVGLLATLLVIGGTVTATYGVLAAMRDGTLGSPRLPAAKSGLNQASTTRQLSGRNMPVPVPSVTERTTTLIGDDLGNKEP
jgi:hypothetical protein